jgi:hypothetical protein
MLIQQNGLYQKNKLVQAMNAGKKSVYTRTPLLPAKCIHIHDLSQEFDYHRQAGSAKAGIIRVMHAADKRSPLMFNPF